MKRIAWMVVGWLALLCAAHAASFDCAKAGTKVEKLICGDAEISKLDDDLNAVYKTALQDEKQADTVKQAQKRWMKERNGCADKACVRRVYEARIYELTVTPDQATVLPKTIQLNEEYAGKTATKKYPPYPDVWEMQFPLLENKQIPALRSAWLDNGDIWLGFVSRERTKKTVIDGIPLKEFTGFTFFSRQTSVFDEVSEEARLGDGSKVKPIKINHAIEKHDGLYTYDKNYYPGTAVLKDGSFVISSLDTFWRGCYQGPAGNTLTRYQSKVTKKPLQPSKVVFLLLDEPITISTGSGDGSNRPAACEADEKEVTTRVVSLYGEILPLEDGGFLLTDENYGWAIRFDANLNTQSKLLNKKLFVFETDILDAYFIRKITGKNYRGEHGYTKMQQLNDDLYAYLNKLNKGEK